jgi:hypothetical protein
VSTVPLLQFSQLCVYPSPIQLLQKPINEQTVHIFFSHVHDFRVGNFRIQPVRYSFAVNVTVCFSWDGGFVKFTVKLLKILEMISSWKIGSVGVLQRNSYASLILIKVSAVPGLLSGWYRLAKVWYCFFNNVSEKFSGNSKISHAFNTFINWENVPF